MRRRNDPFESMERLFEQMRQSMASHGGPETAADGTAMTVEETDEGVLVIADLPGFEESDIDVRFDDGLLTVAAESESGDDQRFQRRSVRESVHVPVDVDVEAATASYRNGVLEVTLPTRSDDESGQRIELE